MVSYDEAVAIVQDPQADPVMLAKVAYENPEFGANVAAHPRAYPGLKRWIAQFGDERARRMVAQQGYESPLGPIEDREEAAQPEPAVAAEVAEVAQTPASFEPQGYSGVKMLDEQFNSLPDESVLPSFVTSADVQAMAHDAAQSSPQAYEPQQPAEQSYDPAQQQAATGADPAGRRERIRVHGAASGHHQRPGRHAADCAVCTRTACGARRQPLPLPRTAGMARHVGQPGRQRGPLAPPVTPYNA